MKTKIGLAIFLAALSGCTALKQNVVVTEPTDGPRARIRVVIPNVDYHGVRAFPDSACVNRSLPNSGMVTSVQMVLGFEKNLNGKKIGVPETLYSADTRYMNAEIYAKANEPITFNISKPPVTEGVGGGYVRVYYDTACNQAVSFTPISNGDYELVFSSEKNCPAVARQLIKTEAQYQERIILLEPATACSKK
jgi:hypothetical protein